MRLHVLPYFGARPVGDINIALADAYREKRAAEYSPRRDKNGSPKLVSPTTINRELEDLRRLLAWARHRELIAVDPLGNLDRTKREELFTAEHNVRRSVIEEPVLAEILAAAGDILGDHARAFVAFLLLDVDSGMRREEMATLTWPQIDAAAGVIKVWWSKTDEPRETILSARTLEALRLLRLEARDAKWVFVNPETGTHYHKDTFSGWMRRVCDVAGIEGPEGRYWLHDGRRTFSTNTARAGVSTADSMELTGHTTVSTFLRYKIKSRQNLLRAKQRIEEYMSERSGKVGKKP